MRWMIVPVLVCTGCTISRGEMAAVDGSHLDWCIVRPMFTKRQAKLEYNAHAGTLTVTMHEERAKVDVEKLIKAAEKPK